MIINFIINDIATIAIYCKPQASKQILETMIIEAHQEIFDYHNNIREFILIGDCNIDLKKYDEPATKNFINLLRGLNFTLASPNHSSSIYGTQIDYCFTKNPDTQSYYYETIFSDHKAVWTNIELNHDSSEPLNEILATQNLSQTIIQKPTETPGNKAIKSLSRKLSQISLNV